MEFLWSLFLEILLVSMVVGIITMSLVQKTKKLLPIRNSFWITIYSLIINLIVGFCFSLTFTTLGYINGLWVGLLAFIGADNIYKALEGKGLVKKFNEVVGIPNVTLPEVTDEKKK